MARILVIEDNAANLDLMTYLLQAFGHAALSATDGSAGWETIRNEKPDLVLCDINLPKMDGYEVVRTVRGDAQLDKTPVVAITALAMVGDRDKILAAGFDGYIGKPIDPERFISDIESFLPDDTYTRSRPEAANSEALHAATAHTAPRATLLAVDNAPVNLELMSSIFVPLGYRVLTALSGADGLQLAVISMPDIIVSDLHMPDMDGVAFIGQIKDNTELRQVPFIFLSSTGSPAQQRERCLALGALHFLARPIEPQQLIAIVEQSLEASQPHGNDPDR